MKYTIKNVRTHMWNENEYEIGLGRKDKLTWQTGSIVLVVMGLAVIAVFALLATLVTIKFLAFIWMGVMLLGATAGTLIDSRRHTKEPFRFWPYKKAKYDSLVEIKGAASTGVVEALEKLVKYPELEYFALPDDLVEETLLTIKFYEADKITAQQLEEYGQTLQGLIDECERRRYTQLLAGKESHNASAKAALEVAKKVNGDLG